MPLLGNKKYRAVDNATFEISSLASFEYGLIPSNLSHCTSSLLIMDPGTIDCLWLPALISISVAPWGNSWKISINESGKINCLNSASPLNNQWDPGFDYLP